MVTMVQIRRLAAEIARRFRPHQIILFGSYANGNPNDDSDVDLFIVMSARGNTTDEEYEIRQATRTTFPIDILVRTPQEIARRIALNDFFLMDIVNNGLVLYEATDARMGQKSRS